MWSHETEESLLRSLLSDSSDSKVLLFSRPAAWSDITIRIKSQGTTTIPKIKSLGVKLSYDFGTFKSTDPNILEVQTKLGGEDGVLRDTNLLPYFEVSETDIKDRSDGRGR